VKLKTIDGFPKDKEYSKEEGRGYLYYTADRENVDTVNSALAELGDMEITVDEERLFKLVSDGIGIGVATLTEVITAELGGIIQLKKG